MFALKTGICTSIVPIIINIVNETCITITNYVIIIIMLILLGYY